VGSELQLRHTRRAILARRLLRADDNKEGIRDVRMRDESEKAVECFF
jgi:hypothetical protein